MRESSPCEKFIIIMKSPPDDDGTYTVTSLRVTIVTIKRHKCQYVFVASEIKHETSLKEHCDLGRNFRVTKSGKMYTLTPPKLLPSLKALIGNYDPSFLGILAHIG